MCDYLAAFFKFLPFSFRVTANQNVDYLNEYRFCDSWSKSPAYFKSNDEVIIYCSHEKVARNLL